MLYDFGPRLLKLRKDKNLTQQMVVERAKGFDPNLRLSDSVLGKYESDLAVPRLTEAAALADVLNVSLDYLTSGEKCNVLSLKELSPAFPSIQQVGNRATPGAPMCCRPQAGCDRPPALSSSDAREN